MHSRALYLKYIVKAVRLYDYRKCSIFDFVSLWMMLTIAKLMGWDDVVRKGTRDGKN
jgi:hypothetical protein